MNPKMELIEMPLSGTVPGGLGDEFLSEGFVMSQAYFEQVGYNKPWIGYVAKLDNKYVGMCSFKGAPQNGRVEIAYGTSEKFRGRGIATTMAKKLIEISNKT